MNACAFAATLRAMQNVRIGALVALLSLVVSACAGGTASSSASASTPSSSDPGAAAASIRPVVFGAPAGDAQCDLGGHDESYHIHVRFRYTVAGAPADPDSNIGIDETKCMYWVHTHDATGGA